MLSLSRNDNQNKIADVVNVKIGPNSYSTLCLQSLWPSISFFAVSCGSWSRLFMAFWYQLTKRFLGGLEDQRGFCTIVWALLLEADDIICKFLPVVAVISSSFCFWNWCLLRDPGYQWQAYLRYSISHLLPPTTSGSLKTPEEEKCLLLGTTWHYDNEFPIVVVLRFPYR